jgi:hypothetical protein
LPTRPYPLSFFGDTLFVAFRKNLKKPQELFRFSRGILIGTRFTESSPVRLHSNYIGQKDRSILFSVGLLTLLLFAFSEVLAANSVTLQTLETYGNFHAGGITVTVSGDDNRNAAVNLQWRLSGESSFKSAHPLTRIDSTHFAGSLFWLKPGTDYEVQVTLTDPDGVSGNPTLVAMLKTRSDTLVEPAMRTWYVSPTGNDSNSGADPDNAFRTIQRAANISQPGDLVLVMPGLYRESVSLPRSGTATQPIVFRGTGTGVIVDGADEAMYRGANWTLENGVYSCFMGFPTGHVVTELGRLYKYSSLSELQTMAAGFPGGFYFAGEKLHVKFPDGSSPQSHKMHAARYEDGFTLNSLSHVRIENLEIRHFGSGSYGKGVYLRYCSNVAVRQCRIHDVGSAGIWIKGGSQNLVEENEIWDTSIFGWPWGLAKGSSAENNGIVLTNEIGQGNVIRRNVIHGTFNGLGPCGSSAPPTGITNETDLYDNTLYEHTDDGMEPEGYCSNVRIWNNTLRDVHMVFAVAPAAPGPTSILRNVGNRFGNTRTSRQDGYTASALKINSGYSTPIGPLYLYHNTFWTDSTATDAVALLNPGYSTFIKARNNIMAGTRYALYKVNPVVLDWNYGDLFTTDTTRFVSWLGTRYGAMGQFRSGTGQELNGLSVDPEFLNAPGGDFRLPAGNALIDRGLLMPGINDQYAGSGPDVGAVESAPVFSGPAGPAGLRIE